MPNFTNINGLGSVEPLNLSFGNLTTINGALQQVQDTAAAEVGNMWFIGSITLVFLMLSWWFYRPDKTFAMDMTRSILVSSAWSLFISIGFLLSGWINTVLPIIWFSTVFTVSVVAAMKLKGKGL